MGKDPKVEQESTIGPVAEVIEEVVLLLCSEIKPSHGDQEDGFGAIPKVILSGEGSQEIASETSIHHTNGERDSFSERDIIATLLRGKVIELVTPCSNNLFVNFFTSLNRSKLGKGSHKLRTAKIDEGQSGRKNEAGQRRGTGGYYTAPCLR